jgi:hypothetical protein
MIGELTNQHRASVPHGHDANPDRFVCGSRLYSLSGSAYLRLALGRNRAAIRHGPWLWQPDRRKGAEQTTEINILRPTCSLRQAAPYGTS